MMTQILMSWFKESTQRQKKTNADLHKALLNKTMTTQQEYCVYYDFVAPLTMLKHEG